ncbi:MAG: glycosyltransferase family 4 protein [Acidimicrobiia bacterium]|nr:glycosyltransferase family 4 protein [Acidimicrobiia bacterium]
MSEPLRVAVDATPVVCGRTGIAAYVRELVAALPGHDVAPLLFSVGRAHQPVPAGCRHLPVPSRIVHRSWGLGGPPRAELIAGGRPALVHATSLLPPTSRRPVVATVQDLAALERPDLHPERSVRQLRALVAHLHRAVIVLAISEATAEVVAGHGVDRSRIVVTPLGLVGLGDAALGRVVDAPYLLAVGEQMPRKGLDLVLEALAADPALPDLVHVGPEASGTAELRAAVERLGLGHRVRFLGFVPGAELSRLVRDADALVYPSLAEGFGLPVLEAMAVGTPVVASDLPALREVAGDAAVLVPAGDVGALATGIGQVLSDDALRVRLRTAGPARAATFTWDRCAALTAVAYNRALEP